MKDVIATMAGTVIVDTTHIYRKLFLIYLINFQGFP
jgi:hypothetical protein